MLYSCSAWAPLVSDTRLSKFESIQNRAARIISGCIKSTDIETLLLEANFVPVKNNFAEKNRRYISSDNLYKISVQTPKARLVKMESFV